MVGVTRDYVDKNGADPHLSHSEAVKWNHHRGLANRCRIAMLLPTIEYRHADTPIEEMGNPADEKKFGARSAREIYRYIHYINQGEHAGGQQYQNTERVNKSECILRVVDLLANDGYDIDTECSANMWRDDQISAILDYLRRYPPEEGIPNCRFCDERVMPVVDRNDEFPECPNCGVPWERLAPDPFQTKPHPDQRMKR